MASFLTVILRLGKRIQIKIAPEIKGTICKKEARKAAQQNQQKLKENFTNTELLVRVS